MFTSSLESMNYIINRYILIFYKYVGKCIIDVGINPFCIIELGIFSCIYLCQAVFVTGHGDYDTESLGDNKNTCKSSHVSSYCILTLSDIVAAVKQGCVPSYLPMVISEGNNLCSNSKVNTGLMSLSIAVWRSLQNKRLSKTEEIFTSAQNNRYVTMMNIQTEKLQSDQ